MFNIYRIHFVEKALIVSAEDAKEALRRAVQYVDPQARVRKFVAIADNGNATVQTRDAGNWVFVPVNADNTIWALDAWPEETRTYKFQIQGLDGTTLDYYIPGICPMDATYKLCRMLHTQGDGCCPSIYIYADREGLPAKARVSGFTDWFIDAGRDSINCFRVKAYPYDLETI